MKKNILIFSSEKNQPNALLSILSYLSNDFSFELRGVPGHFFEFFKENKWPTKKRYFLKNYFKSNYFEIFLFSFLKPFLILFFFFELLIIKHKKKYSTIIFLGANEKLLLSPITKLLKINSFWLEAEDRDYKQVNKKIIKKIIKIGRRNKIICLNELFKSKIENLGISEDNIYLINPGIETRNNKYQENIFSKIAKNENNQVGKKFFTIGTITDLNDKTKIETLFSAFKNSMEIVPRMQLILVGEGEYAPDKNPWAKWLAKKMGIDTMVWFITDTKNLKKWLDSFDIFVLSSRVLKIDDYKTCLYAMESGLAPLAPSEAGFDDLIIDGKNGYKYNLNDSRTLSDLIIKLYKNRRLQIDLNMRAKEDVIKNFQAPIMLEKFKKIL